MPARTLAAVFVLVTVCLHGLAEPPKVVKASPDNGDTDVDPALKEIRITFDQPMSPTGHSIVGGGPNFPKLTAKPRWAPKSPSPRPPPIPKKNPRVGRGLLVGTGAPSCATFLISKQRFTELRG